MIIVAPSIKLEAKLSEKFGTWLLNTNLKKVAFQIGVMINVICYPWMTAGPGQICLEYVNGYILDPEKGVSHRVRIDS